MRKSALKLMHTHGLVGWRFSFDRAKTRLGICDFTTRTISLSKHWVEVRSLEESEATILHELAHALVGPGHNHNMVWALKAKKLGLANPTPCTDTGEKSVGAAWIGLCPNGHKQEQHRAPKRVSACGLCSKRFNPKFLLTWKKHGQTVPMTPAYTAELTKIKRQYGLS